MTRRGGDGARNGSAIEEPTTSTADAPAEATPRFTLKCQMSPASIAPRRLRRTIGRPRRGVRLPVTSPSGRQSRSVLGESTPTTPRWSSAPRAGASPFQALPHRLRWSALQPPREWRNGRRAGLRIRCPKGRGSSTLPSRTPLELRIFVPVSYSDGGRRSRLAHACSQKSADGVTDEMFLGDAATR